MLVTTPVATAYLFSTATMTAFPPQAKVFSSTESTAPTLSGPGQPQLSPFEFEDISNSLHEIADLLEKIQLHSNPTQKPDSAASPAWPPHVGTGKSEELGIEAWPAFMRPPGNSRPG